MPKKKLKKKSLKKLIRKGRPKTKPRIGIVGSSQLALYLAQAARLAGYQAYGMSDKKTDPASSWFNKWIKGKPNKLQDLKKISQVSSVVLFENKTHLQSKTIKTLKPDQFFPRLQISTKTNDLWTLKELLYDYEVPQTPYIKINGKDDLEQAFEFFQGKAIIKHRFPTKNRQDTFVIQSLMKLNTFKNSHKGKEAHFVVEKFLNFKSEHRIIIARNQQRQFSVYPLLTLNHSGNNYSHVTNSTQHKDFKPIIGQLKKMMAGIQYCGVMTFHVFNSKNRLYVDDADCRPCNTGMITLDGFNINQFDLHLRAVLNLNLPEIIQYSKKLNCKYLIAGPRTQVLANQQMNEQALSRSLSKYPNGKLYWYGKKEKRPNRKLGHINYTG